MLRDWLPLSNEQKRVLRAIVGGAYLKAHRHLDGYKVHKLHFGQSDSAQNVDEHVVADGVVDGLRRRGLIDSNLKFPAATYMLTDHGAKVVQRLLGTMSQSATIPLTVHNVR